MNASSLRAVIALGMFASMSLANCVTAQPSARSFEQNKKNTDDWQRRMGQPIPTATLQEKIPFARFLEFLNKHVSKESKFTVRLDREAFGNDANKMLKEEVGLPPVPARMPARVALALALYQVAADLDIEFRAGPSEYFITTRDRSLYTAAYDISDLLPLTRRLHEDFMRADKARSANPEFGEPFHDLKADPTKPAEWIVRQLLSVTNSQRAGWYKRTPASTIRVANGTKLIVFTAPSVHADVDAFLDTMRRMGDVAVVMNAKLYSLDRAEYDTHFASAFVDPKDKSARRLVSTITTAQWKKLQTLKPILESDPDKLRPNERATFLTLKNLYQYQAHPGDPNPATAFEGFSFAVRPMVSPDRRCLRLEFFHDVNQLVKLTKGMKVDLKTGKEMPIELPNVRKNAATATIEIHDAQAIVLAVDYRPKDKVWLVLAEPRIYMEEEEERLRKDAIKPMLLADEKPEPPEPVVENPPPPPPVQLPDTDEVRQILQAVVEKVLTDPKLRDMHDFYGTPKDGRFALDNDSQILWPKNFNPKVAGYVKDPIDPQRCFRFERRLMGMRIDHFDWDGKKADVKEFKIEVVLHNIGGMVNGAVIGAGRVSFTAKRKDKRWVVDWTLLESF